MQPPPHAKACLKSQGLHQVWLVEPPGRAPRTIKTWPMGPWMAVKLLMGIAQPQRQLRGMRRLRKAGVRTPQSLNSWRIKTGGGPVVALELEYAPGQSAAQLIGVDAKVRGFDRDRLLEAARQVGEIVARLSRARVFHRDLRLSNVVVDLSAGRSPTVWVIDTVGVRSMRRRIDETERMLERLAVEPIRFEAEFASAIRRAVLRSALRPLCRADRLAVLEKLRARISGS